MEIGGFLVALLIVFGLIYFFIDLTPPSAPSVIAADVIGASSTRAAVQARRVYRARREALTPADGTYTERDVEPVLEAADSAIAADSVALAAKDHQIAVRDTAIRALQPKRFSFYVEGSLPASRGAVGSLDSVSTNLSARVGVEMRVNDHWRVGLARELTHERRVLVVGRYTF